MTILSPRMSKFVASYQLTGNATESAKNAGYSAKTAHIEGWRLLKNPKIIAELEQWKAKKMQTITKEDYIDTALKTFEKLDITQPNSPRFYDIAGKALGYINNPGDQRPNQTLNITINTEAELNSKNMGEIWENTRKLLGS